eukprot:gene2897-biopygen2841
MLYSDGEEFASRSGRRRRGRVGFAPGSAGEFGRSGSRAAGLSIGRGSSEFWGAAGRSDGRDWRSGSPPGLSDEPPRVPPPRALSPAGVSGAEPASGLSPSSRQAARRGRASSGAPAPAAGASSESDSDLSARGLNPSAVPFSRAEPVSGLTSSSTLRQAARRRRASSGAPATAASASSESDSDLFARGLNPLAVPFSPPLVSSRSASGLASEPSSGSEDDEVSVRSGATGPDEADESEEPGGLVSDSSEFGCSDVDRACCLQKVGAVARDIRPEGFVGAVDEAGDHPDPLHVFASKQEANGAFALLPPAVRRQAVEDRAAGKPPTWHAQAAAALRQGRGLVAERRPRARRKQALPEPPEDEIDETVSPEVWQQLRDLEKEFEDVNCTELPDSVQTRKYKASIRLRPDWNGNPLHRRGYKLSQEELRQLRQQLDELL